MDEQLSLVSNAADERENARSAVRRIVTYTAAGFVFGGGSVLMGGLLAVGMFEAAKDVFSLILPVSTGVITYWFATRQRKKD